jgi:hypothetical protein
MTPLENARSYIARGWSPVPIPFKEKRPIEREWQNLRITADDAPQYFTEGEQNIGVLLGESSKGLTDVDLDCPEALAVAPYLLPRTNAIFGRRTSRHAHWLYYTPLADTTDKATHKFSDPEHPPKETIVEARCGGGGAGTQTVFPGSTHKDTGELIEWESGCNNEPTTVAGDDLLRCVREVAAAALVARRWAGIGARHDVALALGGFLARCDMTLERRHLFVQAVAKVIGWDHKEAVRCADDSVKNYSRDNPTPGKSRLSELLGEKTANKCAEWLGYEGETAIGRAGDAAVGAGGQDDARPVIRVEDGQLSILADEAERVLQESGAQIFQRGGALVRPITEEVDAARGRKTTVAQLERINPIYLRDVLGRCARWQKRARNRWTPTNPSLEVAATILARAGEWQFPSIAGVITTPTMRPDGTLLTQEGYDAATRLLLIAPPSLPPIPDAPTRGDAQAALALLKGLLAEFPLADDVARAVALSALITPVVRGAFPVAPMHAARAPVAASGKSYLFDVVAAIAIGQPMPVMAAGRDEAETEKRLGAALLAGQPLISIDNVNGELFGDALCQIVERPLVEVRILGKSERARIEARGTSVYCTGNNTVFVGDLCRRVITATLDPKMERPELREFSGDPMAAVLTDRGAYIAAALTICRAYLVAGRPGKARRLASFKGWSDTVRSALIWLGEADPVASIESARSEDPKLNRLRAVLVSWADAIGVGERHRVTMREVVTTARAVKFHADGMPEPEWPELKEAVYAVAGSHGPPDERALGLWARGEKGRVVDGLRLWNDPNSVGGSKWWIERADDVLAHKPGRRFGRLSEASVNLLAEASSR